MRVASPLLLCLAVFDHVQALRFLGRVNPSTRELTWPGTGVSFTFTGTFASIGLDGISGSNSVQLSINGQISIILNVTETSISTPPNLPQGTHTVTLRKRSETSYGTLTIGNITANGAFQPDSRAARKLEFIGDSITVGYGLDGKNPCASSAALQNNPHTYAALAASALAADYTILAWSGIGLVRNYMQSTPDTNPTMPNRWTRYGANDPAHSYPFPAGDVPDAVVINLGTNDFGYQAGIRGPLDARVYEDAMVRFVQLVTVRYPRAAVFLLSSAMLRDGAPGAADKLKSEQSGALAGASRTLTAQGRRVRVVDVPTQGEAMGCDGHPDAETHRRDGKLLEEAVRLEMGW